MYYWSSFPFYIPWSILIMKYLTSAKLCGLDETSVYWKPVIFFSVSLTSKSTKNYWYIWQYISGWRFLHKLKSVRLLLRPVYLERFKSSMIFYKVSICPITLDFFSFFIPKKSKCIEYFCLGLIFTFSNLYLVLPHNLCNALNSSITTYLLSSIQRLLPCIRQDIRQVRYLSPTLLPASTLHLWRKRSSRSSPLPTLRKKVVLRLYNKIFPNILCKISLFSGLFHDALTKI